MGGCAQVICKRHTVSFWGLEHPWSLASVGGLAPIPADTKGQLYHKKPRSPQRPHSPSLPLWPLVMAYIVSLTLSLPFLFSYLTFPRPSFSFVCMYTHNIRFYLVFVCTCTHTHIFRNMAEYEQTINRQQITAFFLRGPIRLPL